MIIMEIIFLCQSNEIFKSTFVFNRHFSIICFSSFLAYFKIDLLIRAIFTITADSRRSWKR